MTASDEQDARLTPEDEDRILSMQIAGRTIRDNLETAIREGHVIRDPDGTLSLPLHKLGEDLANSGTFPRDCAFLNLFMFKQIYAEKQVPFACSTCYKVKVETSSLRQLMASKEIADAFSCRAKSQSEVDRPENSSVYATYYYLLGLDKAHAVYEKVRALIDRHPHLGPAVKVRVKRGCTNYERACGPSDKYTFDPQQAEIEAYFRTRFRNWKIPPVAKKLKDAATLLGLIRTAYRIGDQTYKDFTDGKELLPPTVDYAPRTETK